MLRDHTGKVCSLFSKSVEVADSNVAEFMAILEAVRILGSSQWCKQFQLIIESDSKVAISWATSHVCWNWEHTFMFNALQNLLGEIRLHSTISMVLINRDRNSFVDILAKSGVGRLESLVV